MIQEHVRTEIDFRDIGDRRSHAAANCQKIASSKQQQADAPRQRGTQAQRPAVEKPHDTAINPDHQRGIDGGQKRLPHAEPEIDARHGLLRIGKIDQDRRIEPKPPMPVQLDVHGENRGRQDGDQHEIDMQHLPPYPFGEPHPERRERQQQRQGGNISRDGAVERQAVPYHPEPLLRGSLRRIRGIVGQKNRFLHRHQQDRRAEYSENKSQFLFYHTSKIVHIYAGSGHAPQPGRIWRRMLRLQLTALRISDTPKFGPESFPPENRSAGKVIRSKKPIRKVVQPRKSSARDHSDPKIIQTANHPAGKSEPKNRSAEEIIRPKGRSARKPSGRKRPARTP